MNIAEYFTTLTQDLLAKSGANADFIRTTFVETICNLLEDQGYSATFNQVTYKFTPKGYAVDAWSYDEEHNHLCLVYADFRNSEAPETLTNSDLIDAFSKVSKFILACESSNYVTSLESSAPVAQLAWFINENRAKIEKLSLVIASNAEVSARVESLPKPKLKGLAPAQEIWDLRRLYRLATSGKEREDIEIDLTQFERSGVRCLPAFSATNTIQSYLLAIPGSMLAELYHLYGERLLEQNVRTFLQFRGKVNKGIRNTIVNEPQMFFAYNNGISATAEAVITNHETNRILSIKNLQIVNGGQTTASIFTTGRKEGKDLGSVYVQMKLSIVESTEVNEIVPRISEYANTQNKVSAADFFSNAPFQLRIEELSRRLWAPSKDGGLKETHWYYERTRGQYATHETKLTNAEKRLFLAQNPKDQMFTKTDLAKYALTFEELPHIVSLGAQKAFAGSSRCEGFAILIKKEWEASSGTSINETWFKKAIAKAIIFRELDKLIMIQPWYTAYKANIVTYTLAKMASIARESGLHFDYLKIWQLQTIPRDLAEELTALAKTVSEMIISTPPGATSNPSEWAKNQACWHQILNTKMSAGKGLSACLVSSYVETQREKEGAKVQGIHDSIAQQTYVVTKGAPHWQALRDWNAEARKLSPKEVTILEIACNLPKKIPTEYQAPILIKAEKRAIEEGFFHSSS